MGQMVAKVIKSNTIQKSETSEQLTATSSYAGDWIQNPATLQMSFQRHAEESIIIPQCIRAYKSNIVGFGIGMRYKDEYADRAGDDETPEMKAEWDLLKKHINKLNIRKPYKKTFEEMIENREQQGIAYLEVIRDVNNVVAYVENIQVVSTISKTAELDPAVFASVFFDGEETKVLKKFKKYRQEINGKTIYFKEFGDPRVMDKRSGKYAATVPKAFRANEIIEVKIGMRDYGLPRWYGQMLGVDGGRRAENLNRNYFIKGRHTPLLIAIEGGSLSPESEAALQEYMSAVEGENGQHAFLLLETEKKEGEVASVSYGDEKAVLPKVEVKDLAAMLQKDELFQDYIDNGRKRVQSAFNLPDVYVGYTTDYNRATVLAAMEVTEQQVFNPERDDLDWILNYQLFSELNLKYCEAYFRAPELNNVDDIVNLLNAAATAGGVSMNKAKEILYKYLGETSEPYPEEWGELPVAVYLATLSASQNPLLDPDNIEKSISKATGDGDESTVVVMKMLKQVVEKLKEKVSDSEE